MNNYIFEMIEKYNRIIILRHSRPDLDAMGSQIGLKIVLKDNFPEKEVYATGDVSSKYGFLGEMDNIPDSYFDDALVIICDVAVGRMVSDDRYTKAPCVIVVDHHKNDCDITNHHYCDSTRVACAEYLAFMLYEKGYKISPDAATALYGGIVTDSGRFMYGERLDNTFLVVSKLVNSGANPKYIYDNIYVETLEERKMKDFFTNRYFVTENGVAYLKNDKDVMEKFNTEFNNISRGMLSVMAGVKEITIWLNFTYDIGNDVVIGEFRSRNIPIVDIAKKWGGGGHSLACGATIKNWEEVELVIKDFDMLANNNK